MLRVLLNRLARLREKAPAHGAAAPESPEQTADRLIEEGNRAEDAGRHADACDRYREAIARAPRYARAHLNLGIGLEARGDSAGAIAALEAALAIDSTNPYARYNLGRLLFARGLPGPAEAHLRQALEHKADFAEALIVLSAIAESKGGLADAVTHLEAALALRPDDFGALYRQGMLLYRLERLRDAEAALRRACVIDPDSVDAGCELATVLRTRRALPEAEQLLRSLLQRQPGSGRAREALYDVLYAQGKLTAALAELESLLRDQPDRPELLYNHGLLLKGLQRLDDAESALRRVVAVAPDFIAAHRLLGGVLLGQTRIAEALQVYADARMRHPEDLSLQSAELFALNFSEDVSADALYRRHQAFGARLEALHAARTSRFRNAVDATRKLRVGFLSGDLRLHVVAFFMIPLLERIDRSAYEICCYSVSDRSDEYSHRLAGLADVWRECTTQSETELAETIERDGVDILVDLVGHSGDPQLGVFARQPAPVQATWLGYLNTTGLTRIQYRLCDRNTDPPDLAERHHTEELVRLPHSQWCYRPAIASAPGEVAPLAKAGFVTFGSFTQPAKLSPSVRQLWAEILRRIPDSRLRIVGVSDERAREALRRSLERSGVAASRIEVLPYLSMADYLASFSAVDIALDTFPYSGGTTTCDTLWMGVPVVTLPGDRPASRSAASILHTVGLSDWIASTPQAYVRLAVERAGDPEALMQLRRSLRQQMLASPLMDELGFARDMESAFRGMWRRWCDNDARRVPPSAVDPAVTAEAVRRADAHAQRFDQLQREGRTEEALQELEAALTERPGWLDATYKLGLVLMTSGRLNDAEAAFRRVLALDPFHFHAYRMLASVLHRLARIDELVDLCRIARRHLPERFDVESFELFALNFSEDISAESHFQRHRAFGVRLERAISPIARGDASRDPNRRLRVGFLSGDFSRHPVTLFLLPALERHDRSAFEIYCYSSATAEDEFSRQVARQADVWRRVDALTDHELAQTLAQDGIDVAVDLSGHAGISRLGAFAYAPAPVQVAWLGYLNTTGMTRIGYRLCDRYSEPPDTAERLHTESLVRLPHSQWCYRPFVAVEGGAEPPCLHNGFVTFGSFNQAAKLSPSVRRQWARILAELPSARLVILGMLEGAPRDAVLRDLSQHGIEPSRVTLLSHLPLAEYYRAIDRVDIALDTFPYSGGTTTCDTLWMGVPVVTLPGDRPASRSAASILHTVGLSDWIASTPQAYVRLAVERAGDPEALMQLRRSLRQQMLASPLMDEAQFTRDLESAFRQMWRRWCNDSRT